MDISLYFQPIEVPLFDQQTIGTLTEFHDDQGFPSLENVKIAFFGVMESRGSSGQNFDQAANAVRNELYAQYHHSKDVFCVDLGNIAAGNTKEDTYHALSEVTRELNKKGIVCIYVGGSHDLTYANYLGYEKLEQTVNLAVIDSIIDIENDDNGINNTNFLSNIILHHPNYLFNYSAIGHQTYYVKPETQNLMGELFFESHRLGMVQANITHTESLLRNADIVSVDMSVMRAGEFGTAGKNSPNGLYGEQICQMMRYAGISDKVSSLGIHEFAATENTAVQAKLIAQMLWCFIDGYAQRKGDFPIGTKEDYIKYRIQVENSDHELIFYRSDKSDRWWIDVPYPPNKMMKFERHHIVPCNYEDYKLASEGLMPDIWWKTYQKLN